MLRPEPIERVTEVGNNRCVALGKRVGPLPSRVLATTASNLRLLVGVTIALMRINAIALSGGRSTCSTVVIQAIRTSGTQYLI
jgi:hypothetical protein